MLFDYITTDNRDLFLKSIRSITQTDLRIFDRYSNLASDINENTRSIAESFRVIITLMGSGCFDRTNGNAIKSFSSVESVSQRNNKILD